MATQTKYEASLKVSGKTYKGSGKSAFDAISNIVPGNVKALGVLEVKKGKKKQERIWPAGVLARMFNSSPSIRDAKIKSISLTYDI